MVESTSSGLPAQRRAGIESGIGGGLVRALEREAHQVGAGGFAGPHVIGHVEFIPLQRRPGYACGGDPGSEGRLGVPVDPFGPDFPPTPCCPRGKAPP